MNNISLYMRCPYCELRHMAAVAHHCEAKELAQLRFMMTVGQLNPEVIRQIVREELERASHGR